MHVGGKISNLVRGKNACCWKCQTYGSFEKQRELPVFQKEQIEKKRQFCASCYAKYFLTSVYWIGYHELPAEVPKK